MQKKNHRRRGRDEKYTIDMGYLWAEPHSLLDVFQLIVFVTLRSLDFVTDSIRWNRRWNREMIHHQDVGYTKLQEKKHLVRHFIYQKTKSSKASKTTKKKDVQQAMRKMKNSKQNRKKRKKFSGNWVRDAYCSRSDSTWFSWSVNDDGGILLPRRRLGYIQFSVLCAESDSLSFDPRMLSYELFSSLL